VWQQSTQVPWSLDWKTNLPAQNPEILKANIKA
jgi:hypothetical protein